MSSPYTSSSSRDPVSPLHFGNPFINDHHLKQMQPGRQGSANLEDSPYMAQLRQAAEGAKERQLQQALAAVKSLETDHTKLQGALKTATVANGVLQEQNQRLEKQAQEREIFYQTEKMMLQEAALASSREAGVLANLLKDQTEVDNVADIFKGTKESQMEAAGRAMILSNQRLVKQVEKTNCWLEELMLTTHRAQIEQKEQQYAEKKTSLSGINLLD